MLSGTYNIGVYPFRHHSGRTVYLVDTLGFDDSFRTDTQVLKELAMFLGALYTKNIKLAGIIYFHRITDNKMGHHSLKNLAMFQKLCGKSTLASVALVTTMWDKIKDAVAMQHAERAEQELIQNPKYWGDMLEEGSQIFRHDNGLNSALKIVDYIINIDKPGVVPTISHELIDDHLSLRETTAGQEVERELIKERKRHADELKAVRDGLQAAIDSGNERAEAKFRKMEADALEKDEQHQSDMRELKKNHAKIQQDNKTAHDEEMATLREQLKTSNDAVEAIQTTNTNLETQITSYKTDLEDLKSQIKTKDDNHKEALAKQGRESKAKIDAVQRKLDSIPEQKQRRSGAGGFRAALGGVVLTGVSIITLNPVGAAAGMSLIAGGAAKGAHDRYG